ncbi:MAG: hypothetical protein KGH63_02525, partial [Candidatus Micrarchaeota archaeon]|nr:hypothetical protein [Candidatus Micrarchaeota archaeon]
MASKLKVVSPDMVHDFVQIAQGAHGKPHPFSRLLVRAPTANLPAQGWRTLPVLLDAQAVAPAQGRSFSSPALERLELSRSGLERLGEKLGLGVVLDANASRFHSGEKILQLTPGGAEAAVFLSAHFPNELHSAAPLVRRLL